jgi:predicted Rossmann fold nucleotide-binding protein DprA/Smf involved in DNA uptake
MSTNQEEPAPACAKTRKEALKRLRAARRDTIAAVARRVKDQQKAVEAIRAQLREGSRTVPELAEATGMAPALVLWHVATLKKYGEVLEAEKDGAYFRYQAVGETAH